MKVLVIGGGGREHALAFKAAQSSNVKQVFVAPGNAGTATEPKVTNIDVAADDIDSLVRFASKEEVGLTIVGPEQPLVMGVVDQFQAAGLPIFGPTKAAAALEGSKAFAKKFLKQYNIPTADYDVFTDVANALKYVEKNGVPIVIKADGLAAGKGVVVATSIAEATAAITDMLANNKFGEAGSRVIIEEFLEGEEASFIVMTDGTSILPFATSQDHKRAYENDEGPNTGGMGAYSPAPVVSQDVHEKIMAQIITPTIEGMKSEGAEYLGFLYAGLMIDRNGNPKVIEFNCRFGDPETQPIMYRLKSDIVNHCLAACEGRLCDETIEFKKDKCISIVLAAEGYPGSYEKGKPISGLDHEYDNTKVFHSGTRAENGQVVTNGGRVLCVTTLGDSITEASQAAYRVVDKITWDGRFYRSDIGYRAIARESGLE